jgi:hypothetical protein
MGRREWVEVRRSAFMAGRACQGCGAVGVRLELRWLIPEGPRKNRLPWMDSMVKEAHYRLLCWGCYYKEVPRIRKRKKLARIPGLGLHAYGRTIVIPKKTKPTAEALAWELPVPSEADVAAAAERGARARRGEEML